MSPKNLPVPPPRTTSYNHKPKAKPRTKLLNAILERKYTVVKLKQIAKTRGLKGYSKLKKSELIALIKKS